MNDAMSFEAGLQGQWLDAAGDALTAAFMLFDADDRILAASRQLLVYFPVSPHVVVPGASLHDFLGAAYDVGLRSIFGGAAQRGAGARADWIADRLALFWRERGDVTEKQGMDRWLRLVRRRLADGTGLLVVTDPSETKRREEQWRNDLERVQLTEEILDSLPYPLFVKDRSLTYVAVNKAYCTLRGMTPEDLLGKSLFDTLPAALAARFDAVDRQVMNSGLAATVSEKLVHPDGREMTVPTRKWRLGRPGHYFLVSTVADPSDFDTHGDAVVVPDTALAVAEAIPETATETWFPDRLLGGRVLVASADAALAATALPALKRLGIDACVVRDETELAAFLEAAATAGVCVDLVAIDRRLGPRALDIARRRGHEAVGLEETQFAERLGYLALRHFNRREPLTSLPAAQDRPPEAAPASGIDVLVAEDNDINRIVFSQILDSLGYSYVVATDGAEAVDFWALHRPAIVLMDTTLPGMNGCEASRAIRTQEAATGTRTPIVGVLAQAFDLDRQRCLEAGMDDTLLKPISPDVLEAVFQRHIPQRALASIA